MVGICILVYANVLLQNLSMFQHFTLCVAGSSLFFEDSLSWLEQTRGSIHDLYNSINFILKSG